MKLLTKKKKKKQKKNIVESIYSYHPWDWKIAVKIQKLVVNNSQNNNFMQTQTSGKQIKTSIVPTYTNNPNKPVKKWSHYTIDRWKLYALHYTHESLPFSSVPLNFGHFWQMVTACIWTYYQVLL
jgi:hypothetical protein